MTPNRLRDEIEDVLPRLGSLAPATLDAAAAAVLDTLGCAFAGSSHPTVERLIAARDDLGFAAAASSAAVIGRAERLAPADAAFVNATAAHVLDFDDNFLPGLTHGSAVLVPALIAVAEARGGSGRALLEAYVLGLDVQRAVGRAVNPRHYAYGWHGTSTVGVFGAAAAVARLRGVDRDGVMRALSVAASFAAGSKRQFGSAMKPVHAGLAARHGVFAAALAAAGVEGAAEAFEGPWGVFDLFTASRGDVPPPSRTPFAGHALDVEGVVPKLWPCCGSAHRTIDGLLALRREHGLDWRAIERVDLDLPKLNADNLPFRVPTTADEARFSLHYASALALVNGAVRLEDFREPFVLVEDVRGMIERIAVTPRATAPAAGDPFGAPAVSTIRLRDGSVREKAVAALKGARNHPLSPGELRAKFRDCAAPTLGAAAVAAVEAAVESLVDAPDLRRLAAALAPSIEPMRESSRRRVDP